MTLLGKEALELLGREVVTNRGPCASLADRRCSVPATGALSQLISVAEILHQSTIDSAERGTILLPSVKRFCVNGPRP